MAIERTVDNIKLTVTQAGNGNLTVEMEMESEHVNKDWVTIKANFIKAFEVAEGLIARETGRVGSLPSQ